jgi:hypothetical protein
MGSAVRKRDVEVGTEFICGRRRVAAVTNRAVVAGRHEVRIADLEARPAGRFPAMSV